jgi:hypothetical protein
MSADVEAICSACSRLFVTTVAETAFLADVARQRGSTLCLPRRCKECRHEARQTREAVPLDAAEALGDTGTWLPCVDCAATFHFGSRDASYYAARGWQYPRRCRGCRAARAQRRD